MPQVLAFEDVLDSALAGFDGGGHQGRPAARGIGTAVAYGIFFEDLRPTGAGSATATLPEPIDAPARSAAWVPRRPSVPDDALVGRLFVTVGQGPRPTRPDRHLTAPQRRALADLTALGAAIDASFTREDLRSAFRALARRYHPDRHASRGDADPARLSAQFRLLHDAYRVLARA